MSFGYLKVISHSVKNGVRIAECLCTACGKITNMRAGNIQRKGIKSCGCLQYEFSPNKKHGLHGTRTYIAWGGIKRRCLNKKEKGYKNYGGRGITFCKKWDSFEGFYADMGDAPPGMSIERIDNNKGYSKENCRWATRIEQANNKRSNRFLDFNGNKMTLAQWSKKTGLKESCIYGRLKRGWSIEKTLTTAPLVQEHPRKKVE